MALAETSGGGRDARSYEAVLRRMRSWDTAPETCGLCRTRPASRLTHTRKAICLRCANPESPGMQQTLRLLERSRAALASLEAERKALPGLIGRAVPYDVPTHLSHGQWEIIERGTFEETIVPIRQGHRGQILATARAFPTRHGLCFEADLHAPETVCTWAKGVSIGFSNAVRSKAEPYQGGTLRRVTRAELNEIALVGGNQAAAYRDAWCWPRSKDGWKRLYGPMQAEIGRILRGDA